MEVNGLEDGGVVVRCVFRHTLSQRCYVQLVSGGLYQAVCMEGEGEGSHRFTDLSATTYSVLVYGVTGDESCPAISRDPDYITVVSLSLPSSTIPVTSPPTVTNDTGM